jgi:hypothetical protein
MKPGVQKLLAWACVAAIVGGYTLGASLWYDSTYDDIVVKYHSSRVYRLGWYEQGERLRAHVVVDQGSVMVLEGRDLTLLLLDSDNRARLELDEGWSPLEEMHLDTDERLDLRLDRAAPRDDTYYLVFQNFDFFNLTLRVASGPGLSTQLFIKALWLCLFAATAVIFAYVYRRLFGVDVRRLLGLTRRHAGPGSRAAREPVPALTVPGPADMEEAPGGSARSGGPT